MSDIAIRVENLSKRYRIGLKEEVHDTLAGAASDWIKRPGKNLRRLRRLTTFSGNGRHDDPDIIWALRDVSFEVKPGEVVGIIGRNGAGKSTLLKILSRITHPTSGRVELHGRVSSLLEVGTGFHPELTGRENIYLNGTILGMTRAEINRKFDEIVDFSEVEKFIDTPVKRYSSGMRVRLAFSVAAYLEPEILLIDEVLAVGDVEFQKKCLGKMGDVAKEGRTVLFVSHNMAAISALCSSSLLLKNGNILIKTKTEDVVTQYISGSGGQNIVLLDTTDNHVPHLTRAAIVDEEGKPIQSVKMGCSFGVQVEFSSSLPLFNPGLGIRINTPLGFTVLGTTSYAQSKKILGSRIQNGVFRVVFPSPPLNQGMYYVTLTLADNQIDCARYDSILNFEILPSDVYGTGRLLIQSQSVIFTSGIWSCLNSSDVNW